MRSLDEIRAHYKATFGQPDNEAEFEYEGVLISVLKWRASALTQGVTLYATVGSSRNAGRDCAVGSDHNYEYFVGFVSAFDAIAESMARLAIYAYRYGKQVRAGHTYRASDGLAGGFSGFAISSPATDLLRPLYLEGGGHVEFLMAVPLFSDELDYAKGYGYESLMDKFESHNIPFWNSGRKSVFSE